MEFEWDFSELIEFAKNLEDNDLPDTFKRITKDISKALLKRMKSLTPVDEYDLINGWDGNAFLVKEVGTGFEVEIVNKDPKALWVNDGHKAFNQFGGPYPIKRRIQVRSPHKWQKGDATYYVFGHFFVERGILQLKNTKEIESIILKNLEKWWSAC
jgi:hypothetical protein